ncbi:cellulose synthase operon protein YhjQ [Oleomonas cavernae]|uniref:Cellulose synthase operon protein YhjQ n=1 Tax=Oleomonas cavernae TaxID=2320859 RepID=A0A418WD20_9PROT|nr:cellulose biosynthesis protein BcsQ [Oleomonas cavernae]RJF87931.1 cellulose synthase operon protein YhjQ [Oleomonas cavernae]
MPLIVVSSPKGGVGKTTLVANLGVALARQGRQVTLIDFDVQNALQLHFGLALKNRSGYVARAVETADWRRNIVAVADGIRLLPYGTADAAQRRALENALVADGAGFLRNHLGAILAERDGIILADTAPGPTPALEALETLADLRIALLLSDATSLALLPRVLEAEQPARRDRRPPQLILNQIDLRRRLNRDVAAFVRQRAAAALLGTVRQDESLAEAVAQQESVFAYAAHAGAAQDIATIAQRLDRMLFPDHETVPRANTGHN